MIKEKMMLVRIKINDLHIDECHGACSFRELMDMCSLQSYYFCNLFEENLYGENRCKKCLEEFG